MLDLINECIKNDKLEFVAKLMVTLQNQYYEVASLSTNGNFQPSWTHTQLLDYITYES
jgi:hypothetical protein